MGFVNRGPFVSPIIDNIISQSMLKTYNECRRKYYYSYLRRLEPIQVYMPFLVGTIFHECMAIFYTYAEVKDSVYTDYIDTRIDEAKEEFKLYGGDVMSIEKQRLTLQGMMLAYVNFYSTDLDKYDVLHVEKQIGLPIGDGLFAGTLDLLLEDAKGRRWIMDHKTISSVSEGYLQSMELDYQTNMYKELSRKVLKIRPYGMILNIVTKPSIRQKQNEQPREFLKRIYTEYTQLPNKYFSRHVYRYNPRLLRQSLEAVNVLTREILRRHNRSRSRGLDKAEWPQTGMPRACYPFASGKCPYFDLCRYGENHNQLMRFREKAQRYDDEDVTLPKGKHIEDYLDPEW
jgi:hypothetical protein